MSYTIAAQATPSGVGGVAVVRISGDKAYEVAAKVFKPKNINKSIMSAKGYTALYGYFICEGVIRDELVALMFRAPHSYTGEDVVELSCHGGSAVAAALLRECYKAGAEIAPAGEFTKRAFLSGRISLTQAEAIADIINAKSQRAAIAAAGAMEGALYKEIEKVRGTLLTLAGHISAYTDYPEEDVPQLEYAQLEKTLINSESALLKLISTYDQAAIIKNGVRTAIVGSPNVGKSTLLNLLSGYDRAIVTAIAGTTRDVVKEEVSLNGITLLLADTAGIRVTEDEIEAEGIKRSLAQMNKADLVIAVFDASKNCTNEDISLAKQCEDKLAIGVLNKGDLDIAFDAELIKSYFKSFITISAKDREFLTKIHEAVEGLLHTNELDTNAAVLANERQLFEAKLAQTSITDALSAVKHGVTLDAVGVCIDEALNALFTLTGENASEQIIDEIFSRFCVGK